MKDVNRNSPDQVKPGSALEFLVEILGWMQIFASPFLAGVVVAALIYLPYPNKFRLVTAIGIGLMGIIIGAVLATRAWRKKGTIHLVSGIMASPELDNREINEKSKTRKIRVHDD